MLFTEDAERYVDVSNIVCALTCYNYREDILELEEGDLILLMSGSQGEERGGSKAIFSTMNRKIKQANKYGEQ